MTKIKCFLICLIVFFETLANATTWDEPWQEEILMKSESMVLLRIDSINNAKGIWATVIRNIAGEPINGSIHIDGFFALRLTSYSGGHGPEFRLPAMDTSYFFLKKGENNNYQMPTPTSGFAWKKGNLVSATYRISMHKAIASVDMYEKSMSEIFKFIKSCEYDREYFNNLFSTYLNQNPGNLDGTNDDRELFFKQHIALETFYYVGDSSYFNEVEKFLDSDQAHHQISAIRALSKIDTRASKQRILSFIKEESNNGLARVLAIQALRRLETRELAEYLEEYLQDASTEWVGFGLDILEPRVGTRIPADLKSGIEELLEDWEK